MALMALSICELSVADASTEFSLLCSESSWDDGVLDEGQRCICSIDDLEELLLCKALNCEALSWLSLKSEKVDDDESWQSIA